MRDPYVGGLLRVYILSCDHLKLTTTNHCPLCAANCKSASQMSFSLGAI